MKMFTFLQYRKTWVLKFEGGGLPDDESPGHEPWSLALNLALDTTPDCVVNVPEMIYLYQVLWDLLHSNSKLIFLCVDHVTAI